MSRFVLFVFAAVMALGLTACGPRDNKDDQKKKDSPHRERYERRW